MVNLKKAICLTAASLMLAGAAHATVLVNETNSTNGLDESFSFNLTATGPTLSVSFAGYNPPGIDSATNISLTSGGGPTLLGPTWNFTGAGGACSASSQSPTELSFEGQCSGRYDTYSQTINVTPGEVYALDFSHLSGGAPTNNGFLVQSSGSLAGGIPEPAEWALMLLGIGLIGAALRAYARLDKELDRLRS